MLIKKRGQAAMEFLMTYGWAILVVLVVIGALAYFGVLNPQSFLPKKCQFSTGLVCADHVLYETKGLKISINNGLGNDIKVKSVSFTSDNSIVNCAYTGGPDDLLAAGNSKAFTLVDVDASKKCDASSFKGGRIKGKLNLGYLDLQTQFEHQQAGTLLTDVEADPVAAP